MKHKLILFILCASLFCLAGGNLLQNEDFNGDDLMADIMIQQNDGQVKVSKVTEDLSWNQCVKMEITAFKEVDGKKLLSAAMMFGKNGKNCGVPVKPETFYSFSLELKGTRGASFWIVLNDEPTAQIWKGESVRPTPKNAAAVPNSWTKVNGQFKTKPNTKYATLKVQFWADSSQMKTMPSIGDYVMVDNVKIEEMKSLLTEKPALREAGQQVAVRPAFTMPTETVLTLPPRKLPGEALSLPVSFACDDTGITFTAELPPARQGLMPVQENGLKLWKEDVVELFFAPPGKDRLYTQFAISSGGGRYRGTGTEDGQFDRWSGKTWSEDGKRVCTMNIPWEQIGYASRPPAGTRLGINIGVFLDKKNYAYAPVKTSFSDVENFASVIFGTLEEYHEKTARELGNDAPESMRQKLAVFAASTEKEPGKLIAEALTLQEEIKSARLGTAPFLVAQLPLTWNFSYPLVLDLEHLVQEKVALTAAANETVMLPIAIQNRTAKTAAYRVIVHSNAKNFNSAELTGLGNGFPAEKIIFREAIPVKDAETDEAGLLYDPLPRMNEAQTIVIPSNETGLVWLEFDCEGVKPGHYPGSLRVIPLSEPAVFTNNNYKGKLRDYPLEVEVLPFQLPPPRPISMFNPGVSQEYFQASCKLGAPSLGINTWNFLFKFDSAGNLIDGSAPHAVEAFNQAKALFATAPAWVRPSYHIGYSLYRIFKQNCLPKSIKPMTPEWENCWRNYLKACWKVTTDCGITPEQISIELVDEPKAEYEEEYLAMTRIAAEILPEARFLMCWGAANFGFDAEKIARFEPYLKIHEYHHLLLNDPAMVAQIQRMQSRKGVQTFMYECNTNIREALHSYFRLHPWIVRLRGFDGPGFYTYIQSSWGQPGAADWKRTTLGAITYRSDNHCIPSIRMYALQAGVTDVRYWDALEAHRSHPDVAAFLSSFPEKVVRERHDPTLPDQFRAKAIQLLLKTEAIGY